MKCTKCYEKIELNQEHYVLNGSPLCSVCYNKYFLPKGVIDNIQSNELRWEYQCQTCMAFFSIKVPIGPREERAVKCPMCKSNNLQRINKCQLSNTAAGG